MSVINDIAIEQPKRRRWTRDNGWEIVRVWKGTEATIAPLVPSIQSYAETIDIDEGCDWELTATYSSDNITGSGPASDAEQWYLNYNEVEKLLHCHDRYTASKEIAKIINAIDSEIDKGESPIDMYNDPTSSSRPQLAAIWNAATITDTQRAAEYLTHLINGVVKYEYAMPVIKSVYAVSFTSQVKAALNDVNEIKEYSDINVPGIARFVEPKWLDADGTLQSYEWLKKYPNLNYNGSKTVIEQEWWGSEKASEQLYKGGSWNLATM